MLVRAAFDVHRVPGLALSQVDQHGPIGRFLGDWGVRPNPQYVASPGSGAGTSVSTPATLISPGQRALRPQDTAS